MSQSWESSDKKIKKTVLKPGEFSEKLTECSICNFIVNNISVTGASNEDLKKRYHTEILNSEGKKVLVIGDASANIDRKIERVLQTMNIDEKSFVTIKYQETVDSELVIIKFEITLIGGERHKPMWKWSTNEKYQVALKYKKRGVELFKDSRIIDAFYKFSRACKFLITLEPIEDLKLARELECDINNLRLVLYNNMATCQLSRKNYQHVISLCTKVLDRHRNNVKALYRRGIAYGSIGDHEKAVMDLRAALILEPSNCIVKKQLNVYNSKVQESIQKNNDMVKRMFKI